MPSSGPDDLLEVLLETRMIILEISSRFPADSGCRSTRIRGDLIACNGRVIVKGVRRSNRSQRVRNSMCVGSQALLSRTPLLRSIRGTRKQVAYACFFFGLGLAVFGTTGASGAPSIEDRRPEVNV